MTYPDKRGQNAMKMRKIIRTLILALMLLSLLAGCGTSTRDIDLSKVVSATADPNEPRQDPKPHFKGPVMTVSYREVKDEKDSKSDKRYEKSDENGEGQA